ncbi:translation initiation factor IF-2, chloroplastic-like [Salvia miltiorrhiza]|uniref:translation initiation factor IF-2, chloroplastic-like n=1 Tax=Salvia miltiorrhiza TaxID=226208 RepID=UPI0025AB8D1C|nr:translation initiation factor IF-2, chloroplastic-like [Salvia miltiorrhiza]XP_057796011.1 translation initiation factor IF-2, chloroplastic-like [Salvia miltiorrhiza]
MASLASLANLGSLNMISFGNFDGSVCLVRSISIHRNGSSFSGRRWRYVGVCRYSVTTDYIAEQGTSVSLDSTYGGSKESDTNTFLKAAPKPVLKSGSKPNPLLNMTPDESKVSVRSDAERMSDAEEERSKVIESLGEVLEKAEKLETSKKPDAPVSKPLTSDVVNQKNGKPFSSTESTNRKSNKTNKSVWRKGNPVSAVQKIGKETVRQEPRIDEGGVSLSSSQPVAPPTPPQPPQKTQPKLQERPSVAPPAPAVKKPVILKDVGAASKPLVSDGTGAPPKSKERKPILIDKFASKKPVVDPLIAQAVLAPTKPAKTFGPAKFKDGFRKRGGPSGAPRRRLGEDGIPDEDTSELDVSIRGAATARKGRKWSKASRKAARLQAAKDAAPVRVEIMEVGEDGMSTEELAYNLATSEGEILGYLYSKGIKPDGVLKLSKDMVKMVCEEYDVEIIDADPIRVEEMAKKKEILDDDDLDKLEFRPPVLTIMGHVDHGKTSLLDYIRKSKVAASEAGGITQGIGAYRVQVPIDGKPQTCVFLDTPGHEAFGAMRARGARVTDIAIIVVAADDGIQPQTTEAIAHAKAAGVPIIVAINKIDKDGANPDRVMQDLSSIGLMPEEWGGDIPMVKISALKGENVDELLETVMLVSELQELKANPHRNAKGTVIEAGLDKSRGPVTTFIVQNGTLKRGDVVVCGEAFGKVRALFDDKGKRVDEAGPSIPVQVIGLNNVPLAGDEFEVVSSLDIAREQAESRADYMRNERIMEKAGDGMITLSSLASAVSSGKTVGLDLHQLNIILKVDVQGSIEAVRQALQVLPRANISLKFLLQATGDVSSSDVDLAVASKAIIFGFNVKVPGSVKSHADNKGVEIRLYKVIYELIDDVRNAMEGLLDPVEEEVPIGMAEVRAVFSSGSGRVAGCMVTDGKLVKGCGIRVLRKGKEVHVGVLDSLRRVKEMVKEVNSGLECGIGAEDYDDWEEGDSIEAFNKVEKKRTLEEASAFMSATLEEVRR